MDFTKLKEFTVECDNKIITLSEKHNIGFKLLKQLCREVSFGTKYTYQEAIIVVSNNLKNKLSVNEIIMKYNLDKELFLKEDLINE